MQVSFMVPRAHWNWARKYSDYYLILSHQVTEEDVDMFHDKYVILDNGAYELGEADKEFEAAIEMLHPDEIVLPDKRFDSETTYMLTRNFLNKNFKPWYRYIGVVQGRTWEEWWTSYKYCLNDCRIDVIGITDVPIVRHPLCEIYRKADEVFSRLVAMEKLDRKGLLKKPIHILGSIDPIELRFLSAYSIIERTDSKIAFWNGVHEDRLSIRTGLREGSVKVENMSWDWNSKLSRRQKSIIKRNIKIFYKLANGGYNG